LLIGTIIGGLLYFLGTYFYQRVIIPTQQNTMSLNNLNTRIENQWGLLNDSSASQDKRINEIESQLQISSNKFDEIELSLTDLTEELGLIKSQQTELNDRLDQVEKTISGIEKQQADILKDQEDLQKTLQSQDNEQFLKPLLLEIQSIKVLQHINRSRLFLIENNYGLAKSDLQQGRFLLSTMMENATKEQQDIILLWSARLDLAISHLPDNPDLAGEDLEIIWSLMSNGFSGSANENLVSSEIGDNYQGTETPQADNTVTPELTLTPTPTPTTTQ
jgi:archaellum component FlaC